MEEKLRFYFLKNGYYVVRGIKYKEEGLDITDIDLFLYSKSSSLSRERINVDIKNKKTPKAFERIIWTKGLMDLLNFDSCVIATTEKRELFRDYCLKNKITFLDGNFLNKLNDVGDRLTEEEFMAPISKIISYNTYRGKTWSLLYEDSKSRLLNELDFIGLNKTLSVVKYFLEKCFISKTQIESLRLVYATMAHLLITIDFILKDVAFLNISERKNRFNEGLTFGNLGRTGIIKTIGLAKKISNSVIVEERILSSLENPNNTILIEYFTRSDISKNIFPYAKIFEHLAYDKKIIAPTFLEINTKAILCVLCKPSVNPV